MKRPLPILLAGLLLAACGQTGPLYLPGHEPPHHGLSLRPDTHAPAEEATSAPGAAPAAPARAASPAAVTPAAPPAASSVAPPPASSIALPAAPVKP